MNVGRQVDGDGNRRDGILRYRVDLRAQTIRGVNGEEHDSRRGGGSVGNGQLNTDPA